jgi:catechol 2,3-dioxygenase-like lactoylglutathione lyase family enzyme
VIKAISALRLAVADVDRSLEFYKKLGFQEIPGDGPSREVRSNWFRIRFEKRTAKRGSDGVRICMSVDDVDAYGKELKGKRIEASREPAGKSEELVVVDPDGYTLLFFATKGIAQKGEASHRPRP